MFSRAHRILTTPSIHKSLAASGATRVQLPCSATDSVRRRPQYRHDISSITPGLASQYRSYGAPAVSQKQRKVIQENIHGLLFLLSLTAAIAFYSFTYRQSELHLLPREAGRIAQGSISYQDVQKHKSEDDCWVIIDGLVYDLTQFIKIHPGGRQAILSRAGQDVSELFAQFHPSDALESLAPEACLGPIDLETLPAERRFPDEDPASREASRALMPGVEGMLLVQDFEHWAERVLSKTAWAYYRSAVDEENTFQENRNAFQRYFFRPRVLRGDMNAGSMETTFVDLESTMPIFISPAAMAKLGHPAGEVNLVEAAGECGVVQAVSSNASCSLDEMFNAKKPNQHLIFQLYLNKDRSASGALIRKVEKLGAAAIMFTVDTSWESKRTLDERSKYQNIQSSLPNAGASSSTAPPLALNQAVSGYQDRNLSWADISFIRRHTNLPIIVKGVQCLEDVQKCVDHGAQGVVLSNHGGRQADYAPAPIDVLYEIRCLQPDLFDKIDVLIDGGIRSGADVVKALALGAKAVGLGRPFLYANGTHGRDGVRRVIEGARSIQELRPEMVGPAGPWTGLNRPPYAAGIRRQ